MGRHLRRAGQLPGMTLIELLVAMLMFVIGCLGLISLQTSSMTAGQRAIRQTTASFLAETQLEWFQAMEFNEVPLKAPKDPEWLTMDGLDCPGKEADPSCYVRSTTVTAGAGTSRSCHITVQVSWAGGGDKNQVIYDTIVSDFGF